MPSLNAWIVRTTVLAFLCAPAEASLRPQPSSGAMTSFATMQEAVPESPASASQTSKKDQAEVAAVNGYAGMRVASIKLQSAVQMPDDRLSALVAQKVGEPLDRNRVRESIQALYATGRFADVVAEVEKSGDNAVALTFAAKENYFVGIVTVDGAPNPPNHDQLVDATRLQLGELLNDAKVRTAINRLTRVMQDNGYHKAKIEVKQTPHPETQQVDIAIRVSAGPPARIGKLNIEGDAGYTPTELEEISGLHPGRRVSLARTNKALQRIRDRYQHQDRLEAQVAISQTVYHADTNTVDYNFQLQRGPTISIDVEGASIPGRKLRRYVPAYEENAIDEDLLNEGRRNLRDYLQTQGYFEAQVEWRQTFDAKKNHRQINYVIDLGKRHKLVGVAVNGNKYFDDAQLRERMLVEPSSWLLENGKYSESLLAHDVAAIEYLYKSNGFAQIAVKTNVQDDYKGHVGDIRVVFAITEGPQLRVDAVHIEGNKSISTETISGMLNTAAGEPYSEFNVATDRDIVLNYYFNEGFPDVRVEPTTKQAGENKQDVTYKITEGDRVYVDKVLLSGLHYTKGFTAARQFEIWNGNPLSQVRLLNTQRKLYDLGLFSQVDVAVQNPDGAAEYKNLLVQFDEARRWTFNYGFGFEVETGSPSQACPSSLVPELRKSCLARFAQVFSTGQPTASPRVSLGITRINFRGRDQTIVFKGNIGRLEQTAQLSFEQPRWFNHPSMTLTLSTLYDNSRNVQTFTSQRVEASAAVQQSLSQITTLVYRFSYRRVRAIDNTLVVDVEQIPILSAPVRVGIPSFSYIRDKRDNPIDSHKGNFTTFDFGTASRFFGSEANFNRVSVQNATYQQFGRKKWVFARSTRIGVAAPFGGLVDDPSTKTMVPAFIPLPERFFAGGGNSLRGFDLNGAGPRDLSFGTPLGGGGLFINSLELRTPPPKLPFVGQNISFVFFEDAGNVFSKTGTILESLVRVKQPHSDDCHNVTKPQADNQCSFSYLSHALGTGIRYKTPIGPVRVDVGYNLNPPTFPRYSINDVHTLPRFNFYFSIGQTF